MALSITKQPNEFHLIPVRNPIELELETDNFLTFEAGQKTITTVGFDSVYDMVVGNQFTANLSGMIITFTIATSPANENEVLPRSAFPVGIMGSNDYGNHLKNRFISHSIIGAKFTSFYVYAGMTDTHTDMEFTSLINEPLTLVFTKISGSYTISNGVTQSGIFDEYDNRPTIIDLGLLLVAHGNPADGDHFNFNVENQNFVFYFKTTPDNSGYQLPLRGLMSLSLYQNALLTKLNGAPCFKDKFVITTYLNAGEIYFKFTSIGYIDADIYYTSNGTKYIYTNVPGYKAVYQENFTNNLHVFCEETYMSAVWNKIIELYSYPVNRPLAGVSHFFSNFRIDRLIFDYMDKIYKANLSEALPYNANYPNANHVIKRFYCEYFESYGSPASAKLYKKTLPYFGIYNGIGHNAFTIRKKLEAYGFLHPTGNVDNDNFYSLMQYVDINQPAWLYFFTQFSDANDIGSVSRIYKKVYYTDGTSVSTDIAAVVGFDTPSNTSKAFFLKAGYQQLNIGSADTPTNKAYKWDIIIDIDGDYSITKTFILECESAYYTYLLYQNSCGGYDTVRIAAPKEFSLDVSDGKEVERYQPTEYAIHDSQFESSEPKLRQSIKANIGFKKAVGFDVLKDLLSSKYVFVIPKNTTDVFIPVNIERKSVVLESEDEYVKNFSFEFSVAHEFKNFENNLWLR